MASARIDCSRADMFLRSSVVAPMIVMQLLPPAAAPAAAPVNLCIVDNLCILKVEEPKTHLIKSTCTLSETTAVHFPGS